MSGFHEPIPVVGPSVAAEAVAEAIQMHAVATTELQKIGAKLTQLAQHVSVLEANARTHIPSQTTQGF